METRESLLQGDSSNIKTQDTFQTYGSQAAGREKSQRNVTFFFKVRSWYGQIKAKFDILSSPTISSQVGNWIQKKFGPRNLIQGAHRTPKVGCFFKIFKIQLFSCFITQLIKKLQQWPLYEVKEDILPFVLNTKRPLSNIWLPSCEQNSFVCFLKNSEFQFFD